MTNRNFNNRVQFWGALLFAVGLTLAACANPHPKLTITVKSEGIRAGVVRFPTGPYGTWTRDHPEAEHPQPCCGSNYMVRVQSGSRGHELLVRIGSGGEAYCRECFAIPLQEPFQARRVELDAWEQATPIATAGSKPVQPESHLTSYTTYRGRRYERTGDLWGYANLSSDERFLMVTSNSDRDLLPSFDIPFLTGGGPTRGPSFTDVYDTASGELVFSARTRDSDLIVSLADWAGDRYCLQTLGRCNDACLLVVFPEPDAQEEPIP